MAKSMFVSGKAAGSPIGMELAAAVTTTGIAGKSGNV
jgi:hypothetical protein